MLHFIQVNLPSHDYPLDLRDFNENTLWRLKGANTQHNVVEIDQLDYPQIVFEFEWERKV